MAVSSARIDSGLCFITPAFMLRRMQSFPAYIHRDGGSQRVLIWVLLVLLASMTNTAGAEQQLTTSAATGAKTWALSHAGVHFSLTQILPEQGDAFYVNRGFSLEQIAPFTSSCVFMTVLRNDAAPGIVHFVRSQWQVRVDGKSHQFKTVAEWLDYFRAQQVARPALIAFQWAQFPPEQEYEPGGDWNQGMLAVGLSAGQRFDITAHWDVDGAAESATLTEVECAE